MSYMKHGTEYGEEVGRVLFSAWRKEQGYKDRDTLVNDMSVDGHTEDEIDEEWDKIVEEFQEYCDDNDLEGEEDE